MLGNLLIALGRVVDILLELYMWIVIARALLSWVNPDPYNPVVRFLYQATEPALARIRRVLPNMGGLDLSPLLLILAIVFLQRFIAQSLLDYGIQFRFRGV